MPRFLKDHGEDLVRLGYRVVPIKPGTKWPNIADWQNLNATSADVVKWYSNGRANHGVGVLARETPAIDVDVLDDEVAQAMSDAIDAIFPGVALMTRTGLPPKFLVPFRSIEPFRKISSAVYTDGEHDHKVEILGDGQQWVAYHVHPDTGKPYSWAGDPDDAGIATVPHDQLPVLSVEDAQRVVDAFEAFADIRVLDGRWRVRESQTRERTQTSAKPQDDPFAGQPVGKNEREVVQLLKRHTNGDVDYDRWFAVLAAIHHELGDEGRDIAYDWSASSAKHTDEKFDITWPSLGRYPGPQITLRSLLKNQRKRDFAPAPVGEFVSVPAFIAAQQNLKWLVRDVIPERGLVVLYGAPGSSKSFFALDLVAHIARGLPWRGHRTKQAKVAYIAAEGMAGFGGRLAAYAQHEEVDMGDVPFLVRGGRLSLNDSAEDLASAIAALEDVGIVVIDTLASVTSGVDENTSEGMGEAIDSANLIMEKTGAAVILVHHANKNGELRGWSGLLAAADNTIRVEHDENTGVRTAHIEKQKDGPTAGKYGYRLKVVEIGIDEYDEAITSCVIDPCDDVAPNTRTSKKERKSTGGEFATSEKYAKARHYLHVIEELTGLGSDDVDEDDIVRAIQNDETVNPLKEPEYPRAANIKRTLLTLADHGKIRLEGHWIRVCD